MIALGVLSRTIWHIWPNVELVTSIALLSASNLSRKWMLLVIFSIMAISDLIIGNTNIFIFTWSAYLLFGLFVSFFLKKNTDGKKQLLQMTGWGIVSSVWFYLWTNFGVWLLDSFGMYQRTLTGLFASYIYAIPFFKFNLIGNIILVPLTFVIFYFIKDLATSLLIQKKVRKTG